MFNKSEYDKEYHKAHLVQIKFALNKDKDSDILNRLDEVGNKNGYLKKLIRKDIEQGS